MKLDAASNVHIATRPPARAAMTLNVYAGLFPDRLDVVADALDEARRTLVRPAIMDVDRT